MKNFFFFIGLLFLSTNSFAQDFLEKRQAPKELAQDETPPLLHSFDVEGLYITFEKAETFFQDEISSLDLNKDWYYEDLHYRIEIDEKGKVLSIEILNPSVHEQINEIAYNLLNSIKSLAIIPATKSGKTVAYTYEGYLLFDMCKCAYGDVEEEIAIYFPNLKLDSVNIEPKVFMMVEEMPIFGACKGDSNEKDFCSEANVEAFIKSELSKYTFENEGKVFIRLVINENGLVDASILKKCVFEELDIIALKIFENMPPWQAGKLRGEFVKVSKIFPVSFVK